MSYVAPPCAHPPSLASISPRLKRSKSSFFTPWVLTSLANVASYRRLLALTMSFAAVADASYQPPSTDVAEERLTKLASGLQQFQQQCVELQRMVIAMKADAAASGRLFTQLALVDEMSARLGLALSEGSSVVAQQFRARHAKLHKDYRTMNEEFAEVKALAASKVQASESRSSSNPQTQFREGSPTGRRQQQTLVSVRKHEEVRWRGGGGRNKKTKSRSSFLYKYACLANRESTRQS